MQTIILRVGTMTKQRAAYLKRRSNRAKVKTNKSSEEVFTEALCNLHIVLGNKITEIDYKLSMLFRENDMHRKKWLRW